MTPPETTYKFVTREEIEDIRALPVEDNEMVKIIESESDKELVALVLTVQEDRDKWKALAGELKSSLEEILPYIKTALGEISNYNQDRGDALETMTFVTAKMGEILAKARVAGL